MSTAPAHNIVSYSVLESTIGFWYYSILFHQTSKLTMKRISFARNHHGIYIPIRKTYIVDAPRSNLKTFIDTNRREVLIVEFDMGAGSSPDLRKALVRSGLIDYVYIPEAEYAIEWPTLGDMIELDKRLLLFGVGDGMASCPANKCVDGILHASDHLAETATGYGADLFSCEPTSTGELLFSLFRVNQYDGSNRHLPSPRRARELNSYANLKLRFENCRSSSYRPNLLAVEFWDEGDVVAFAQAVNSGNVSDGGGEERRTLRGG